MHRKREKGEEGERETERDGSERESIRKGRAYRHDALPCVTLGGSVVFSLRGVWMRERDVASAPATSLVFEKA